MHRADKHRTTTGAAAVCTTEIPSSPAAAVAIGEQQF